ncbi:hypothetical protein Vadar_020305 [Vaccinium darrowii]|uniref:Uncharacterized protein n=1 Tax=Vaccinium darrowii TaxID=229202 RepID=A0ACB7YXI0_9ERIC|nr:hypothetical protein Vadar_020305 [Vaccinium darrowii]
MEFPTITFIASSIALERNTTRSPSRLTSSITFQENNRRQSLRPTLQKISKSSRPPLQKILNLFRQIGKTDGALAYLPVKLIAQIKFSSENSLLPLVLFETSRTFSDRLNTLHQTTTSSVVKVPTLRSHVIPTLSIVEHVVEKLLIAAVADADVTVRHSIFSFLHGNVGFDDFLAQADRLSAIFVALNDEDFEAREYAISVAGRLSEKNPAYVLPALRRHLIQLLTYLEQSADSKCREESAKLLGCLIRHCERLILPYISPIHKALVTKLYEGTGANANSGIISGVLVIVGDLARVGGFAMRRYIPEPMPLIVDALLDGAAAAKREVAVVTLGQVVQSTGYVVSFIRSLFLNYLWTWAKMPLWHKTKLLYSLVFQAFFLPSPEDLNKMLKEMDDVDMFTLVIQEMSKQFPTLMETLMKHLLHVDMASQKSVILVGKILRTVGVAVAGVAIISGIYLSTKK